MTDEQIAIAKALGRCSLPLATERKRFIQNMKFLAENSPHEEITDKQDRYLRDLAFQFRRQLPAGLVITADANKSYSVLQWMAPELVKSGLVKNEPWVEESCARAAGLYKSKEMQTAGVLFAAVHPQAIDYLLQVPIIALAASRGYHMSVKEKRLGAAQEFQCLCLRRPRLKEIFQHYETAPQLRNIAGGIISHLYYAAIVMMRAANPSSIAQAIPATPLAQGEWLLTLSNWANRLDRRVNGDPKLFAEWAVKNLHVNVMSQAGELADFAFSNQATFNERWTLNRAIEKMEEWHAVIARESNADRFKREHGIDWDHQIDYAPLPNAFEIDGYQFVALRSAADLHIEGAVMHHCVGSYATDVIKGRSRIYSIRKDDEREATLELFNDAVGWRNVQLKAKCNDRADGPPSPLVRSAVGKFIKHVNHASTERTAA